MEITRVIVADGTNLVYRAVYAIGGADPSRVDPAAAARLAEGLLDRCAADHEGNPAGQLLVAFDGGGPTWRHAEYEGYKATRSAAPAAVAPAHDLVRAALDRRGVGHLTIPGCEADDLMATIALTAVECGRVVTLVSSDQDLLQLVHDAISMLHIGPTVKAVTHYDHHRFVGKFGFAPNLLPHYKALAGDSTDNLKGCPGIGPKFATGLLARFPGGIRDLYAGIDRVEPEHVRRKLVAGEALVRRDLALATLDMDVTVRHPEAAALIEDALLPAP